MRDAITAYYTVLVEALTALSPDLMAKRVSVKWQSQERLLREAALSFRYCSQLPWERSVLEVRIQGENANDTVQQQLHLRLLSVLTAQTASAAPTPPRPPPTAASVELYE